jgi:hypothetical protein
MPKTTVSKHCYAKFIKYHIRLAQNIVSVASPARDMHASKHREESTFETSGLALDRLHRPATILWR